MNIIQMELMYFNVFVELIDSKWLHFSFEGEPLVGTEQIIILRP